jgi:hypothetical protein
MNLSETDRDLGPIPSSSGIDRSVSYLIVGLLVVCFFLLTLVGLTQVDRVSKQAQQSPPASEAADPETEILGAGHPATE